LPLNHFLFVYFVQVQLSVSIDDDKKDSMVDSPDCVASKWSPIEKDNASNQTECIVDASESNSPIKRPSNLNLTSLSQPIKCKRTESSEEVPLDLLTLPTSSKVYEKDFNILDDRFSTSVVTNQSCNGDNSDKCPNKSLSTTVSDDSVGGERNDCPSSKKSTGSDQQEHEHELESGVWI
jgi:hypothetical protein